MSIKQTIILILVFIVLLGGVYAYLYLDFKHKAKQIEQIAYLRGQNEVLLEDSKELIDEVDRSLTEFKARLEDYKNTMTEIQGVTKDVLQKISDFSDILCELDSDFNTLYDLWTKSN
jgi:archaellum component FlaC